MRILSYVFTALFIVSCGSAKVVQTTNVSPEIKKSSGTFTNAERVGEIMNYLASDDLKGREAGDEGIEIAATYIENYFKSYHLKPYFETYRDTLSNFKKPAYNIVGVVEGNDPNLKDEYILIGAHYDHIGIIKPENGDYIANGANDNASGTTSVLEMARYFGTNKTNKRTLIFALFSAEEKGLLGSKHLAQKLKEQDLNLYTMLNFEMTGVPLQGKDYFVYITGYDMSNLAEVSNRYAKENLVGFLPTAKEFNLYQRSDNYPFHEEFGVPSHTFCTFDFTNFNHYHKVGDENSLMDFGHMATLVNKTIPVIEGIANAPSKEIKLKE
ncbi:M20/M25/M40 family metallo-hydrolase [Muricauda ruestringensis]|uniref:M20/M25/M40 family metallo-hydrolase n=1 Tax=Flagellimonas aurea TaxID=2915619 RepID=A0ABS3G732_9FLAO|nr:M20/M25/M40 family metallo-hydrolase [Allomuricauda aurea]MAO15750.1 peptidase M28 [Allomuricauda sp.]MBO0355221.1 M20/M25/M40 family metallo-hydrolase [Allomuricauda aurea]|tara:strand:- start:152 stop:1129 length:978 start_codon:yes stop_codon:yes gene_type:complete